MARSSLVPGFRFHPTDAELVMYYLKRKLLGKKIIINAVAEVNIYDFSPWDLPDKSSLRSGDLEWFFFCPKAKKYSSGSRSNRATETGFWKATGKDRKVEYKERSVATIKTLVFHLGHAPSGERTNWVMHEYRMEDDQLARAGIVQDMYVLCRIFEKSGAGPKNGAQYGAPFNEEEWDDDVASNSQTITKNTLDHKQKGPATTNMTVPQSARSVSMTEPASSTVTCFTNETTNTLNYKQKDPATTNMTVPQSTRSLSITEPGSSTVTFTANETTNTLDYKQKGPATMNMTVPRSTHVSITEPGSSSVTCFANGRHLDVPANEDVMLLEDIMEDLNDNKNEGVEVANEKQVVKSVAASNEDDDIYDDLVNLINLEELDGAEYARKAIVKGDDLDDDLREFYVD